MCGGGGGGGGAYIHLGDPTYKYLRAPTNHIRDPT